MNIIEAVRSGRPFKRFGWTLFWPEGSLYKLTTGDILSDDWEVKKEKVKKTGWTELAMIFNDSSAANAYYKRGIEIVQVTYEIEEG